MPDYGSRSRSALALLSRHAESEWNVTAADVMAHATRARSRSSIKLMAAAASVIAVVAVVVVAGLEAGTGSRPHSHSTGGPTTTAATPPPTAQRGLLVFVPYRLVIVSPSTGKVIRQVAINFPGAAGAQQTDVTATPASPDAFVAMQLTPTKPGYNEAIVRVPIRGGKATIVARGSQPALSPRGNTLAWVDPPTAAGTAYRVTTKNLTSGATRTVSLSTVVPGTRGPWSVISMAWAPSGSRLAIALGTGQAERVRVIMLSNPLASTSQPRLLRLSQAAHDALGSEPSAIAWLGEDAVAVGFAGCVDLCAPSIPAESIVEVNVVTGSLVGTIGGFNVLSLAAASGVVALVNNGGLAHYFSLVILHGAAATTVTKRLEALQVQWIALPKPQR